MNIRSILLFLIISAQAGFLVIPSGSFGQVFSTDPLPAMGVETEDIQTQETPPVRPEAREGSIQDIGPTGLIELARSLAAQGEVEEAGNTYRLLLERFSNSEKVNLAAYELGVLLYKNHGAVEAHSYLERVLSSWSADSGLREKSRLLLKEIDSIFSRGGQESRLPAIGLILPLTGRYAPYGEAALKGALLAAGVFGPAAPRPVNIIVKDVGEAASDGAGAVTELAGKEKVAGIVGPLRNATAYASAARAEASGVPLITLSQKEDVSGAGSYVFRNSLSPAEQAKAVAEYAITALGKIKFAVLYPDNISAGIMAKAFTDTVLGFGGEVAAVTSYKPGTKDFGKILEELFKIETDEVREGRRTIKEYFPSAGIEALYIPDSYRTVSLITPYIKYYNIEDLQLLGSSGWNSKRLVKQAGRAVEGAVFVDGFFAGSKRETSLLFARHFKETFGAYPGELEAEVYDAVSLLVKAIDSDNPDRKAVRDGLLEMSGYEGAGGPMSFDRYGGSVKKPFILTVKGRMIVEAPKPEPAPETPGQIVPEAQENLE